MSGGPEEWPAAVDGMGQAWAVRTLPGMRARPLVFVKVWPPPGKAMDATITAYDVAEFRALVAKMQEIADSLPPDEVPDRYRLLTIATPLDPGEYRQLPDGRFRLACIRCGDLFEVDSMEGDDPAPAHPCRPGGREEAMPR